MGNDSGDFSALNMQGDMSQRTTAKAKQCQCWAFIQNEEISASDAMYGILTLLFIGMCVDILRELLVIVIILSFILDKLPPIKGMYCTVFLRLLQSYFTVLS